MTVFARLLRVSAGALAIVAAACTNTPADGAPASGGRGAAGGRGGGRGAPSIVLAAADVYTVARGMIEATTPVSGDLRPIEEIGIRARVEGDVVSVLVREGDAVNAGAVLARLDPTEFESAHTAAVADLMAAKADAATAEWNASQSRDLFKAGAISEQALKAAEQASLAAKARQASSESRLQAAENAKRDAQITAPVRGTISQRSVQTGERATRGATLFTLVRDDTLEFTAALPARSAMLVKTGQEVRFTVDGRNFTGQVARVSPAIDPASRSVAIYIRVPNRARDLKANAFASGRVVSSERSGILTVPITAIRKSRQDDASFVYRIEGDQIAVAPVKVGDVDDARGMTEILEGIAENDRVVVGNVGTIGRGMKVQVLNSDDGRGSGAGRGGERRGGRGAARDSGR